MKHYLDLVSRYLSAHAKKTRLTILSVAISVALITGIFSMLDVLLQFEKIQMIHDYGNYHLLVKDVTEQEAASIASRIDVQASGRWDKYKKGGKINGMDCELIAVEEKFAGNMGLNLVEGKYPTAENELMLEQWAVETFSPPVKVNDTVRLTLPGGAKKDFVLSGVFNDFGSTKASRRMGVVLSIRASEQSGEEMTRIYLVQFKDGVLVHNAEKEIRDGLKITGDRIQLNDHLLAVMGQSTNQSALGIYATGATLFCIVLLAGVMMIYNTFNISVMERVQQFGMLRCIGASKSQIKNLVRREGLFITSRAVPLGVLAGMLMTFACSALLKYYNTNLFGQIPLFSLSLPGILAGVAVGILTVFIASLLPARKAAEVSPVSAVAGSSDIKSSQKKKQSLFTRIFRAEIALGLNNAVSKKRTLILMSSSIAISIIMFLGFNVFIDFLYSSLKTTKPYTPDISLMSREGPQNDLYARLGKLEGVEKVYGRMFGYVDATFNADRLTKEYIEKMGGITRLENGRFVPPEKSWLISYDRNQLNWAKMDLLEGTLDEEKLNRQNGVVAVETTLRKNITSHSTTLKLGDRVYVNTTAGTKELTVMGILRMLPFSDSELNLTTFITTEKQFVELTGESDLKIIDLQLKDSGQEQTMTQIKGMLDSSVELYDSRQKNSETNQTFFTMAVFIYGFVAVIALISILNIINTMNTSVAAKTRYLGVMRAVGMSGDQLDKMVLAEAGTYSVVGCVVGCLAGVLLQRVLITNTLSSLHIVWKFPVAQIVIALILTLLVTVVSIISPLKRIKARGITDVIGSL